MCCVCHIYSPDCSLFVPDRKRLNVYQWRHGPEQQTQPTCPNIEPWPSGLAEKADRNLRFSQRWCLRLKDFRYVTLCFWLNTARRFEGFHCHHFQGQVAQEACRHYSAETSVTAHHSTQTWNMNKRKLLDFILHPLFQCIKPITSSWACSTHTNINALKMLVPCISKKRAPRRLEKW
jgi:hypothetical protein